MNDLQTFTNEEFGQVRTVEIDGEPWFVGKDVAGALGYSDTKDAIRKHVDGEDKRLIQKGQITTLEIPNRGMYLINESGLYGLIFASKLPTAKKFKHWVTSEVLPALRMRGRYTLIEGESSENIITPRERLSLAKLIATTPNDRLPAVKEIIQPLIVDIDLDSLLLAVRAGSQAKMLMVNDDEVINTAYMLAENNGIKNGNEYLIDIHTFNTAFAAVGSRFARKILSNHNLLILGDSDIKLNNRTTLRYVNGKTIRCIAIKAKEATGE